MVSVLRELDEHYEDWGVKDSDYEILEWLETPTALSILRGLRYALPQWYVAAIEQEKRTRQLVEGLRLLLPSN